MFWSPVWDEAKEGQDGIHCEEQGTGDTLGPISLFTCSGVQARVQVQGV